MFDCGQDNALGAREHLWGLGWTTFKSNKTNDPSVMFGEVAITGMGKGGALVDINIWIPMSELCSGSSNTHTL